jgi:hypothetical protein
LRLFKMEIKEARKKWKEEKREGKEGTKERM